MNPMDFILSLNFVLLTLFQPMYEQYTYGMDSNIITIIKVLVGIFIALIIYASAKINKSRYAFVWGLAGYMFPILTVLAYYFTHINAKKKFCMIDEPCFKEVYNIK